MTEKPRLDPDAVGRGAGRLSRWHVRTAGHIPIPPSLSPLLRRSCEATGGCRDGTPHCRWHPAHPPCLRHSVTPEGRRAAVADVRVPIVPELPDITVYIEALASRVLNQPLERLRIANPFLVRTPDPPVNTAEGRRVVSLSRMGKRIVLGLEGELFVVLHLMIAGRLRWRSSRCTDSGQSRAGSVRFPDRHSHRHRSGIEAPGVAAPARG